MKIIFVSGIDIVQLKFCVEQINVFSYKIQ
jgi:hypothetical protein